MARPDNLKTRIFLDGGDPAETKEALELLGFLDGQTTNPTLIARNPEAKARIERGEKFEEKEIYDFYKDIVQQLSEMIPDGSISIEVYADKTTPKEEMLQQSLEMYKWIPNAHIKFPIIKSGMACAEEAVKQGVRVNMTLNFNQEQAAAVHAATRGAEKGQVFLSPFIGRLDGLGLDGMSFIKNCARMYQENNSPVEVLAASIRNYDHFLASIAYGADIITSPFKVIKEWVENGMPVPGDDYVYPVGDLALIPYQEFDLSKDWREFNIQHDMTDKGLVNFVTDWTGLIK